MMKEMRTIFPPLERRVRCAFFGKSSLLRLHKQQNSKNSNENSRLFMSQGMLVIRLNNYLRYVSIHSIISLIRSSLFSGFPLLESS